MIRAQQTEHFFKSTVSWSQCERVYLCSKHSLHRLQQLVCVVSERACILFKHTEQGPRLQTQDAYNSPYSQSQMC